MAILRREEGGRMAIVILWINVLLVLPGHAAPTTTTTTTTNDLETTWNRMNVLSPEVSSSFSSSPSMRGGCCLEWLQKWENHDNVAKYARDNTVARLQAQNEQLDSMDMGSWRSPVMVTEIKSPMIKQPSTYNNRLTKKDVFMSRGWGAGSMPFSVLYMNPHNSRVNSPAGVSHAESARALPLEGLPPASVSSKHPNYRVALRNGATGQPRRQYSIIPQLFVSYGWSPIGK